MKENQFPKNEALRLTALEELHILDTPAEQDFDDITRLASQICETPISLITLLDEKRQWFKSSQGLLISETSRDIAFCDHAIREQGTMVVPNALEDGRFMHNPLVTGEPFIRFYAGVPIKTSAGFPLGTLCIIDATPRTLTANQLFALEVLGRQVESMIELRSKINTLENAQEKILSFSVQFRKSLQKIGDNVWEFDFRTGKSSFSETDNGLLGFNVSDIADINETWWQSIHPEDRYLLEENDRKCRAGEIDAHSLEYRMLHKDGSVKWVLDRGVVIEKSTAGLPLKLIGTHTDITKFKNNEEAHEASEQRWKFALEGSGDGIWDLNCKTNKVFYSSRYKEMLGYTDNEIGDNPTIWQSLVHLDDIERVKNDLQIHLSSSMPIYRSEYRILCKDGTYKWILDRGMITARDANNQPLRITGTHTDISQIKYTELALEQSLKQFKSLSDNFPGVVHEFEFRKDGTQGFKYISPAISKIFGIPFNSVNNYFSYLHPDDLATIESKTNRLKETLEQFYNEARLVVPGRGTIWHAVTSSFSYLSEAGSIVYTGFMQDITERKKSEDLLKIREEKYRSIIANMNLGLLEVDTDERIMYANQSFCEMSGYEYDELIGKKAHEIFISGDNKDLMQQKNLSRMEGVSDAYEIVVKDKRGQLRWWLISGAPRFDDSGGQVGSIGIHLDITGQKKLEVELIKAREQAEESTRSKEVFLANMSHEIRTPLNAIVGMSNQLGKTNLDESQQFYLSTIIAASENLLFIINDILDISKIEAGKLQIEKIGFEPMEMVNRAIRVLSHRAEEKGLTLGVGSFDDAISPVLIGDPFRLNQILLNLITNAIKFTEKGGVDIYCELIKDSILKQTIKVTVKDSGIGMEAAFVNNLFEKFSQEDASVTRQYGGTGLGMSICRDLVELMGGTIEVESKKGIGTSMAFIIEFENGDIHNLPVIKNIDFDAKILAGKKILVVDDNKMNRLVAATILKNIGAITTEAVNGLEAIKALQENDSDLVLLDIQMPVMDGVEAIGIIRKQISATLPVIALTANALKGDNDKYIEAGMSAYLSKPYKEKELLNIVALWLNKSLAANTGNGIAETGSALPLYNLSGLKAIGKGNQGFVEKMVQIFIEQMPLKVNDMLGHYEKGDYKMMAYLAHKLQPSFEMMGIMVLNDAMAEVERLGKLESNNDQLPDLLAFIQTTVLQVADLLTYKLIAKEMV